MKRFSTALLVLSACLVSTAQRQSPPAPKIVKFNIPGAGKSQGQGTIPGGIIADGSILGSYIDSNSATHGFLRSPSGQITKFYFSGSQGTFPAGLNSALVVAGYYIDTAGAFHGFLRSPSGKFTKLDVPGAGTGKGQGTLAIDINTKGVVAGIYYDSNGVFHGFLRTAAGKYSKFDAPGAGTLAGQGTGVSGFSGLTDAGAIAGGYTDSNGVGHGFLRTANGKFATFDPAGSTNTFVVGLSSKNAVGGIYFDSTGSFHGFVRRASDGTITSFDAPNSRATSSNNIDPAGTIAGAYYAGGAMHGYVRSPGGIFTEFDVPGAGTGGGQGTSANSSNSAGTITGNFVDSNGVNHGFVRQ